MGIFHKGVIFSVNSQIFTSLGLWHFVSLIKTLRQWSVGSLVWLAKSALLLEFSVSIGLDPFDFPLYKLQSDILSYAGGHHQTLSTASKQRKKFMHT